MEDCLGCVVGIGGGGGVELVQEEYVVDYAFFVCGGFAGGVGAGRGCCCHGGC